MSTKHRFMTKAPIAPLLRNPNRIPNSCQSESRIHTKTVHPGILQCHPLGLRISAPTSVGGTNLSTNRPAINYLFPSYDGKRKTCFHFSAEKRPPPRRTMKDPSTWYPQPLQPTREQLVKLFRGGCALLGLVILFLCSEEKGEVKNRQRPLYKRRG